MSRDAQQVLGLLLAGVCVILLGGSIVLLSWGLGSFWWATKAPLYPWPTLPTPPAFVVPVSVVLPTNTPTPTPIPAVLPTTTPTIDAPMTLLYESLQYGDITLVTPNWAQPITREN